MYCQVEIEFEEPRNCLATQRRTAQKKPRDTTPFKTSFQTSAKQRLQHDPVDPANLLKDITRKNLVPKNSLHGTSRHQK